MAHNLITAASFQTRLALHQEATLHLELNQPKNYRWDSTTSRIRSAGEPLAKCLRLSEEAALTGPIKGTTGFASEFVGHGPRNKRGRSLRDLDLQRRLRRAPGRGQALRLQAIVGRAQQ